MEYKQERNYKNYQEPMISYGFRGHVVEDLEQIGHNVGYEPVKGVMVIETKRVIRDEKQRSDLERWADQIIKNGVPLPVPKTN